MNDPLLPQHREHSREFEQLRFVYPVLSRRSHGLSLGVNLNPDKICNFDCIYCQVDRRSDTEAVFVEQPRLIAEIDGMLDRIQSGRIFQDPGFDSVPPALQRLNDIAFSGDGEPTSYRNFAEIVEQVACCKRQYGLESVRLVLITNASLFHRENVKRGLEILDRNQGQIWGKLDAGTEEYYRRIERTPIPLQRILDNLLDAARLRPIVIQSIFMRINGKPPDHAEITAYIRRLNDLTRDGGRLELVQIYTIARRPAEISVTALSNQEIDRIADRVRSETGLNTAVFYG